MLKNKTKARFAFVYAVIACIYLFTTVSSAGPLADLPIVQGIINLLADAVTIIGLGIGSIMVIGIIIEGRKILKADGFRDFLSALGGKIIAAVIIVNAGIWLPILIKALAK